MKKTIQVCLCLLAIAVAIAACTRADDRGPDAANANNADILFVKLASASNYAEIALAKVDTLKATDSAVKDFGNMMIMDHMVAGDKLKAIALPLGLAVIDTLDAAHQALRTQLMALSGYSFDSLYIHSQVADHQAAVLIFQNEVSQGQYAQLRTFASSQLPILQEHLDKATAIAAGF